MSFKNQLIEIENIESITENFITKNINETKTIRG